MTFGNCSDTLSGRLIQRAESHGSDCAAVDANGEVTYSDLLGRSAQVAFQLKQAGIGRGGRVGLLAGNCIAWLEICFGAHLAGATLVPFSTWSTPPELEFLIGDSAIEILFAVPGFSDRDFQPDLARFASKGLNIVLLSELEASTLRTYETFLDAKVDYDAALNEARPDDDALVLYTSGSTSVPKGVRLQQSDVVQNGFNIGERQGLRRGDRVFLPAPLFWAYGASNALPSALTHGATLVLQEKFDPEGALDLIEQHRCTGIYTLPAMTAALVRASGFKRSRVASLRTGLSIGSSEEFSFAVEKLGVPELCNIYGATETCGNCAVTWHHWPLDRRVSTQGTLLPGQELRIRDVETGEIISPKQTGLMEIRGHTTPGYSGKSAELNEQTFTPDGYYRTGDIGHLDAEGALIFVGRHSEMIKRAGINVSPAEIESVLSRHSGVCEAAVVGVPDREKGEVIVAFIVPENIATFEVGHLSDHLRAALSKYKLPDRIELRQILPLTPTGKLHRKQLKAEALELMA
jgi:fatty-acyl-CoA synthase